MDENDPDEEEALGKAEAAKQDMADDNSMFQAESLHNYSGGAQAAPDSVTEAPERQSLHADSRTQLSPALAAIVPQPPIHPATAQKPDELLCCSE